MGPVVFEYQIETDNDEVRTLEIEVTIERGFQDYKLVSVESVTEDGKKLNQSEIEDLVEEIGEDVLAARAAAVGCDEEEGGLDEDSARLMDELNIEAA